MQGVATRVKVADDELRPYFDAILAAPDDEAPRLAIAAFLSSRGDPRGERIRLACEFEKIERDDPARADLEARWKGMPSFTFFTQLALNVPMSLTLRRGFVEGIECHPRHFIAHADVMMRNAPVREYATLSPDGWGAALARSPALAALRRLDVTASRDEDRAAILASPHLAGLRELALPVELQERDDVERLVDQLRNLQGLRILRLRRVVTPKVVRRLADFAEERGLELLDVGGAMNFIEDGVETLRARLGVTRVSPRPPPRFTFRRGTLDLSAYQPDLRPTDRLRAAELLDIFASGAYRSATRLILSGAALGDDGLDHLARSGGFPALTTLSLGATGITDAGARAFADHAVHLDHLESIDLGEVADAYGPAIRDVGIAALARSSRLPALRTISRMKTLRNTFECPPDEMTQIVRDDGQIVEATISYDIANL